MKKMGWGLGILFSKSHLVLSSPNPSTEVEYTLNTNRHPKPKKQMVSTQESTYLGHLKNDNKAHTDFCSNQAKRNKDWSSRCSSMDRCSTLSYTTAVSLQLAYSFDVHIHIALFVFFIFFASKNESVLTNTAKTVTNQMIWFPETTDNNRHTWNLQNNHKKLTFPMIFTTHT